MKHKVLVVEDEPDTANLLKQVLEREGFSILHAKDGRQASSLIGTAQPPSLILLDLVIPYVRGTELTKLMRNHPDWCETPVIVVSADSYEPEIQQILRQGASAYVAKQKGSSGLIEAMKRVLRPSTSSSPSQPVVKQLAKASRKQRPSARRRPRSSQGKKRAA